MSAEYAELAESRAELQAAVVGSRIVAVEEIDDRRAYGRPIKLTLDNGRTVKLVGYGDCCVGASIDHITALVESDHVITSVTREEVYGDEKWFILADMNQVLGLTVSASEGSGCYSFGISVTVEEVTA